MDATQARGRTKARHGARIVVGVVGATLVAIVAVWLVVRPGAPETTTMPRPEAPDETTTLADHGVVGELWLPAATEDPVPAVVILGGSEGGLPWSWIASAFAPEGIATLSIALFDHPGLPDRLLELPLEQVVAGVEHLRSRPEVDGDRIWLIGISRGSEAVMLTAIEHPGLVHGVVASVPGSAAVCGLPCDGPAWTIGGEGVPSTRLYGATEPRDHPDAAIPVQDLQGRLVTICGGEDEVWPSCRHASALQERREQAGVTERDRHFAYEQAGHSVGIMAHVPRIVPARVFGPDEVARRDLWPQLIEILHDEDHAAG